MRDFSYYKPSTVSEAVALLAASGENRPLSGGMTLLPTMKMRLASPTAIVDLAALPGLTAITVTGGSVTIGAMTTHAEVATSAEIKAAIPALATLAGLIGDPQVRHRGTIGSPATVINAVVDALSHLGVSHVDMPATPSRIWRIIHNSANQLRAAE